MFAKGFDEGFEIGMAAEDFDLPHPQVHERWFLLLHRVLGIAVDMLRQKHGSLACFGEDPLTTQLCHVLENDLRQRRTRGRADAISGFDSDLFESILRHTGATDYRGERLKKEPDLYFKLQPSFGLRVLPTEYAIFTECKPVDATHATGSRYCDDGLNRFIEGEYAWAMQDALMVGYARNRSIAKQLIPALRQPERRKRLKTLELPEKASSNVAGPKAEPLHVSLHRRDISWCWSKGAACPIRIYHSWHNCS